MAREESLQKISAIAGADLSAKQYYFVKHNSSGEIVLAGDGGIADGVLQDKPESGKVGSVAIGGVTKVVAGGSVTAGTDGASDSAGKAVTPASGDEVLGRFLESGVSGDIVSFLWQPRGIVTY